MPEPVVPDDLPDPGIAAASQPEPVEPDRFCLACGYSLRGLLTDGACPECGTPVLRSLQGNLLKFSSRDYLAALNRGLVLVLIAIAGSAASVLMAIGGGFISIAGVGGGEIWMGALGIAQVGFSVVLVVGWWFFSTPDPAVLGHDTGDWPRRIIRITVVVSAVMAVLGTALEMTTADDLAAITVLLDTAAQIVRFFAAMIYLRWMAPRLPSREVEQRARRFMWLGPLLVVFGLCIIPYIVAIVMYFTLLNAARIEIRRILDEHHGDGAPALA